MKKLKGQNELSFNCAVNHTTVKMFINIATGSYV